MKPRLCAVLVNFFFAAAMTAQTDVPQNTPLPLGETTEVATQSLGTLRKLVNEQNFTAMGFRSVQDTREAKLGAPLQAFAVTVDDLRKFHPGTNSESLLSPLGKVIFPVVLGEEVLSSITIEKSHGKLTATNFGGAKFIQALEKVRGAVREASAGGEIFIVHINVVNSYFIGFRSAGKLMLAALVDLPNLDIVAGRIRPAEDVFASLAPVAQRYNGLPL